MTTINHSALAGVVAVMTHDMPDTAKVVTLILLVVSHLPLDAIPHYHFYEFKRLRETWKGAVVELGGGFVLIPLLVWIFLQLIHYILRYVYLQQMRLTCLLWQEWIW